MYECKLPSHITFEDIKTITLHPSKYWESFRRLITYKKTVPDYISEKPKNCYWIDPWLKYTYSVLNVNNGEGKLINSRLLYKLYHMNQLIDSEKNKKKKRHLYVKKKNIALQMMEEIATYIAQSAKQDWIDTIIIWRNKRQKDKINLWKKTNRKFYQIPHWILLQKVTSKCEDIGIKTIDIEENHTSKCSFLSWEKIEHHDTYVWKRVKRGLFQCPWWTVHADMNGAWNIARKKLWDWIIENLKTTIIKHPKKMRI